MITMEILVLYLNIPNKVNDVFSSSPLLHSMKLPFTKNPGTVKKISAVRTVVLMLLVSLNMFNPLVLNPQPISHLRVI